MFKVSTTQTDYFFDTDYDAALFARAQSKRRKSPVDVIDVKNAKTIYTYANGKACGVGHFFVK
jgi:hypothetical protein